MPMAIAIARIARCWLRRRAGLRRLNPRHCSGATTAVRARSGIAAADAAA